MIYNVSALKCSDVRNAFVFPAPQAEHVRDEQPEYRGECKKEAGRKQGGMKLDLVP